MKAQIWDTAGQERYRAITSAYIIEELLVRFSFMTLQRKVRHSVKEVKRYNIITY